MGSGITLSKGSLAAHPAHRIIACLDPRLGGGGEVWRCGRCEVCLACYAARWALRNELAIHQGWQRGDRVWLVTLTIRSLAALRLYGFRSIQLWLKRVRKQGLGRPLVYVVIAERGVLHGRPHWHAIVVADPQYLRRDLDDTWRRVPGGGHAKAKIVQPPGPAEPVGGATEAAWYVAKYLTKDAGVVKIGRRRVRASQGWGRPPALTDSEALALGHRWLEAGWRSVDSPILKHYSDVLYSERG